MKNNTAGFTLIELLIVIAIIGILAAVLIPNLLGARQKSVDTGAAAYARNCATAATNWALENPNTAIANKTCEEVGAAAAPDYVSGAKVNAAGDAIEYKRTVKGVATAGDNIPLALD